MRKVYLLGDSIRLLGYGKRVPSLLDGVEVFQPPENGRFAKYTLRMLFDYKEELKGSEVIHWNNGLWDVCNLFGDGCFTEIGEYRKNILRIADILLKITPRVIFATTTPVRDGHPHNCNEDIMRFNACVIPELKQKGIYINDLFNLVYPDREKLLRQDDLIHLNEQGIEVCAVQVARAVKQLL